MKLFVCMLFVLGLFGCSANHMVKDDIVRDSVNKGTNTAVVKISLDKKGMPYVDVDPVVIWEGQRIVWAGPTKMAIRLQGEALLSKGDLSTSDAVINLETHVLGDDEWANRKEIKIKYDVVVGDVVLDPVIIFRKRF